MYKIMIYIDTHSGDKWFYYQENEKDYVAYSLHEIKETVLTLIDTYGKDNIKIVKQVTGEDMEGSVETFIYDSTDNYEELVNRPSINGVEIIGQLSLDDLGIQPAGDYATSERVDVLEETVNNIDFSSYATNTRVDQVEHKVDNIDLTSYATNERVDQVEAKVDAIDLEPYATMDYLDEVVAGIDFSSSNENITGVKTFSVLPRSTVMPVTEDELTNKSYVDHGVENCASKEYVDSLLANISTNVVQQLTEEVVIINDYESGIYQPVYNGAKVRLYNENRTAYTEPTNMTNSLLIWDKEKRTFLALFQGSISLYSYYGTTSESYSFGDKVMFTFKEQEINGKKTFTTLPESSIVPTSANQLVNKTYVDDSIGDYGIKTISGSIAFTDLDPGASTWTTYYTKTETTITGVPTLGTHVIPAGKIVYVGHYNTKPITTAGGLWYFSTIGSMKGFGIANGIASLTDKTCLMYESTPTIKNQWTFNVIPKTEIVPTVDTHLVNKKYVDDSIAAIDIPTGSLNAIEQVETLPTGSEELVGTVYQYIGATNTSYGYVHGNYYICTKKMYLNKHNDRRTSYPWVNAQYENIVEEIPMHEYRNTSDVKFLTPGEHQVWGGTTFDVASDLSKILKRYTSDYDSCLFLYSERLTTDTQEYVSVLFTVSYNTIIDNVEYQVLEGITHSIKNPGKTAHVILKTAISGFNDYSCSPVFIVTEQSGANLDNYYTKEEVDAAIAAAITTVLEGEY